MSDIYNTILCIIEDKRGLDKKPVKIVKEIEVGEFLYRGEVPVCMWCGQILVNSPTIDCDCKEFKSGKRPKDM